MVFPQGDSLGDRAVFQIFPWLLTILSPKFPMEKTTANLGYRYSGDPQAGCQARIDTLFQRVE